MNCTPKVKHKTFGVQFNIILQAVVFETLPLFSYIRRLEALVTCG